MRIAVIGRTEMLLDAAEKVLAAGHEIPLVVTAREAPEYSRTSSDFAGLAEKAGAKFYNSPKINNLVEEISQIPAMDIAISVNYINVIAQPVIDLFRLGILNAHGGDLPRYRGNACQAWAIVNGEDRVGLCIHKMAGGQLDSGDIIARERLDIGMDTRVGEILAWMRSRIPELFMQAVTTLDNDPSFVLEVQSKDPADALRCYPRMPSDGRVKWNAAPESIVRLINASSEPYPGAFCEFDEKRMTIWRAEIVEDPEVFLGLPGQVSSIERDGRVIVLCREGKIRLLEVEMDGDRSAPGTFVRSLRARLT
jgi:methionyl-tRNA formyltransferase